MVFSANESGSNATSLQHLTAGVLAPVEIALLQTIFEEIAAKTWFPTDVEARREFASYILMQYRRGLVAPDRLAAFALIAAKQKFAGGLPLSGALILLVEDDYYMARGSRASVAAGRGRSAWPVRLRSLSRSRFSRVARRHRRRCWTSGWTKRPSSRSPKL